jgi:predicted acylesterase/phospholipase RssA
VRGIRARIVIGAGLLTVATVVAAAVWAYNRYVVYESKLVAWPQQAQPYVAPTSWQPKYPDRVRILALDGGGIRGLITLEVLKEIEERTRKPIAELFDVVAGSSTGAIIASLLLLPDEQGRPRYSASDVIAIYADTVRRVFSRPWYHALLTLDGLLGPKYLNREKIAIARELYGEATFHDLLRPMMILAYSLARSDLQVFTSWPPDYDDMHLMPLVVAATSGPTYFPAVQLEGPEPEAGQYLDGSVLATDPSEQVLLQALAAYPDRDIVLVSVGTGLRGFALSERQAARGGLLAWVPILPALLIDGQGAVMSRWLENFTRTDIADRLRYYRFNVDMPAGRPSAFDNTTPAYIERLKQLGRSLVRDRKEALDEALGLL